MTVALFLLAANVLTLLLFADDKRRVARREWRISERTLLIAALLGGSVGALTAQHMLRHKTRKEPFRTGLPLILAAHVGIAVAVLVPVGAA